MLLKRAPSVTPETAAAIALEHYGIAASAAPLPSERDQNFRLDTSAGERFVLKMSNAADDHALLDAQNAAMAHVSARKGVCPRVVMSAGGAPIVSHEGPSGAHLVRMLSWIPGMPFGAVPRHSTALLEDLGRRVGEIDRALATFDHPAIHRELHWDLAHGVQVIRDCAPAIAGEAFRQQIEGWTLDIARHLDPRLPDLRRSAVHNDANDHNVIVAAGGDVWSRRQRVAGIIDFGDIVHSYVAADPAIAIAYAVLDKPDPLAAATAVVRGYHAAWPLKDPEIAALFDLVRLRLCMSAALAAHQHVQRPGDEYLGISQGPIARTLPGLMGVPRRLAEVAFRDACGLDPLPAATRLTGWLETRAACEPIVATDPAAALVLDLSVGSPLIAGDPAGNAEAALTPRIVRAMTEAHADIAIGRYGEPRYLYSTTLFEEDANGERRTIHLGVDVFAAPGTAVRAPLPGVVHASSDNAAALDYGPVIILKHETDQLDSFYTLYGHLTRQSLAANPIGRRVAAGDAFAAIGPADVNGGWSPHVHFQLIVALLDLGVDFPGVCRASQRRLWQAFSPDPKAFIRVPGASFPDQAFDNAAAATRRRTRTGSNVALAYRDPVRAVRGWMQYLYDATGRRYLDAYNNVPHVGHCHPRVVRAASEQLAVLNTNTRYLHDGLADLAGRLAATLPDPLRVCYFVNSGSEANELALRLARAHTGRRDLLVLEAAYHGNTTTLVDISPYKFAGPGGEGPPAWVHALPAPDVFRGEFRGAEAGAQYAGHVTDVLARLPFTSGRRVCGFVAESCPSVGGQLVLPAGYLANVYARVRGAGGLCIADEVQTAYGRTGTHCYAFEAQGVVPDIVVLGKPIGNGYPLGAVVTTPAIAASFDNGMEFFSTFGGSTVACAAGLAVLEVVQEERLQEHAMRVGARLADGLRGLQARYDIVGDVRGSGLFFGVELVTDRGTLEPASADASFVVNRMREEGILIGSDGPYHSVLKIRPPMPFQPGDADRLVETLDRVLREI
jgi:4-aminobutyrate aminotransferase-like enzyme/Ser/Thr protein kinase RdoA (MazF antagonist)